MATHLSLLAWRIPVDGGAWRTSVQGVAESATTEHAGPRELSVVAWFPFCPSESLRTQGAWDLVCLVVTRDPEGYPTPTGTQ